MLWENSSAFAAAVAVARFFLDKFSKTSRHFQSFLMKIAFWDMFYLEGRFLKMCLNCFPPIAGGSGVE